MDFFTLRHPEEFNYERGAEGLVKILDPLKPQETIKAVRGQHQKIKLRWKDLVFRSLCRSFKQYDL